MNYPRSGGFWHNSSVDEQLRNTILHELGHNIGLSHTGALKLVGPEGQVLAGPTASQQHETLARGVLTPTNKGSDLGDGGGMGDRSKPDSGQNPGRAVSEGSSTAGIAAVLALIAAIVGLIGIVAVPTNSNFGARR